MQAPEKLETAVDAQQFLDGLDTILFDCDGVLWQGSKVISGTRDVLDQLRRMGKRIIFVTNNSTKSRAAYSKKFTSLGLEASPEEIFGSAYAAAAYIKNVLKLPSDKKLYVCGMKGIEEELTAEGIPFVGGEAEKDHIGDLSRLDSLKPDDSIGAVLFGMDIDISYTKYAKAFTYLHSNPDCHFLATNDDLTFPAGGTVYPGTGALLAALKAPLNRSPKVLGKPHQTMLDVIVDKYHLNKERTCMVGDRLDTDIEFGKKGGLKTLLVLTDPIM
ncbi:hypothetical protein HK102_007047 [Quaeritorhiza haematococci]|nr:hypothetical protein HK102_007047 [Quaeritorhiza haematococci]